ncbi:MAG: EamA family transporter [Candidatus Obscuribacterales bacterium]
MKKFYLVGFLILLAFDTLAQVGFKLGATNTAPAALELAWLMKVVTEGWIYVAVAGYIGAFITYMTLLKHAPIGPAFAATHLEIVTVSIVSYYFLGEVLTPVQMIGGLFIIGGIVILACEKEKEEHRIDAAAEKSLVDAL